MKVTGYVGGTGGKWLVEWLEGPPDQRDTQLSLPRLRVYFRAEDPLNFANRVADAHARREVDTRTKRGRLKPDGILQYSAREATDNLAYLLFMSRLFATPISTSTIGNRRLNW